MYRAKYVTETCLKNCCSYMFIMKILQQHVHRVIAATCLQRKYVAAKCLYEKYCNNIINGQHFAATCLFGYKIFRLIT